MFSVFRFSVFNQYIAWQHLLTYHQFLPPTTWKKVPELTFSLLSPPGNCQNQLVSTIQHMHAHLHILKGELNMFCCFFFTQLAKYQNLEEKSVSMAKLMQMDSNFGHDRLPRYDVLEWDDSMMVDCGGDFDHFHYNELSRQIENHYFSYDGFIIIHNIDSLAYTSCYLSFIIENLQKPIVLTSSSVGAEQAFSDGKENLLYSMVIAGMRQTNKSGNDVATFREVVVCFNKTVFRGSRVTRSDPNSQDGFYSLSSFFLSCFFVLSFIFLKLFFFHLIKIQSLHSSVCVGNVFVKENKRKHNFDL